MKKFSFYTTVLSMALVAFAFSNEEERPEPKTREIPHAEWLLIQQERQTQEKEGVDETVELTTEVEEQEEQGSDRPQASVPNAGISYTSHTGAFHSPMIVTLFGDQVELEDGSLWSVSASDTLLTLDWMTSDLLVVTPNHEWFSPYLFKMTNQQTGSTIRCNMIRQPSYNGLYTYWIVGINYYTYEIVLNDGSIWQITGFDSSTFGRWLLNDTIFIGVNDGLLSSSKPNILINPNTAPTTYVRAKCTW